MRLSFTGDILVEKEQLDIIGEGDYSTVIRHTKNAFKNSDLIIGNLETPIASKTLGYTSHIWSFNTPTSFLSALKDFGFDILTTANNHCLDRGVNGMKQTIKNLDKYELEHIGTRLNDKEKNYYEINTKSGNIVLFSYTYGTNAFLNNCYLKEEEKYLVNLYQPQEFNHQKVHKYNLPLRIFNKIKRLYRLKFNDYSKKLVNEIKLAKSNGAKLIIICLHTGGQYEALPSSHARHITKWLMKQGVDIVVGNHEHVIHPIELIGKNTIAFSLGNFTATLNSESANKEIKSKINKTEYSIILHIDISESDLNYNICFQITKLVTNKKGISQTFLLYDLIQQEENMEIKKQLLRDNQWIVRKVINNPYCNVPLLMEYSLKDLKK